MFLPLLGGFRAGKAGVHSKHDALGRREVSPAGVLLSELHEQRHRITLQKPFWKTEGYLAWSDESAIPLLREEVMIQDRSIDDA